MTLRVPVPLLLLFVCACVEAVPNEDPLEAFQKCVQASNIAPLQAESLILKTVFEMVQCRRCIEAVTTCMENDKDRLSSRMYLNAAEGFVGFTFDIIQANKILLEAAEIYSKVNTSTCLKSVLAPAMQQCLQTELERIDGLTKTGNPSLEELCGKSPGTCMALEHSDFMNTCSEDAAKMVMVPAKLFYGKCLNRWNTTVPTLYTTSPPPKTTDIDAFTTCKRRVFPDAITSFNVLQLLFPPSEASQSVFKSVPLTTQNTSIWDFCGKVDAYTSCLQQEFNNPASQVDTVLSHLLDINGLPATFRLYCSNINLVVSQFDCTYDSLTSSICRGGLFDLLASLKLSLGEGVATRELCKGMHDAQECRISKQLTPCNEDYAKTMASFYSKLKSDTCRAADESSQEMGGLAKCSIKYSTKVGEIIETGAQNEDEVYTEIVKYVCGVRDEWLSCVRQVRKTSTFHMDKFAFALLVPENLEKALDYACMKTNELAESMPCVVESFGNLYMNVTGCIHTIAHGITGALKGLYMNSVTSIDALKGQLPAFCAKLQPMQACMKPAFEACGTDVTRAYMSLSNFLLDACSQPQAVALKEEHVSGSSNLATGIIVPLALLISLKMLI